MFHLKGIKVCETYFSSKFRLCVKTLQASRSANPRAIVPK